MREKWEPWKDVEYYKKSKHDRQKKQNQAYWNNLFPSSSKSTAIPDLDPSIATPYATGDLKEKPMDFDMRNLWTDFSVAGSEIGEEVDTRYTKEEIENLYKLAVAFGGIGTMTEFKFMYRCKPRCYWEDIHQRTNGIMEVYLKDPSGHEKSPINGKLCGLFFSSEIEPDGSLPSSSPFGESRFIINPNFLLDPFEHNLYFCDFYCIRAGHYVTLVACRIRTQKDDFCRHHLKQLSFEANNFLHVKYDKKKRCYEYSVNIRVHVELFYTENISTSLGIFDQVEASGTGSSKIEGLAFNKSCTVCNLKLATIPSILPTTCQAPRPPAQVPTFFFQRPTLQIPQTRPSPRHESYPMPSLPNQPHPPNTSFRTPTLRSPFKEPILLKNDSLYAHPDLPQGPQPVTSDLRVQSAKMRQSFEEMVKIQNSLAPKSSLTSNYVMYPGKPLFPAPKLIPNPSKSNEIEEITLISSDELSSEDDEEAKNPISIKKEPVDIGEHISAISSDDDYDIQVITENENRLKGVKSSPKIVHTAIEINERSKTSPENRMNHETSPQWTLEKLIKAENGPRITMSLKDQWEDAVWDTENTATAMEIGESSKKTSEKSTKSSYNSRWIPETSRNQVDEGPFNEKEPKNLIQSPQDTWKQLRKMKMVKVRMASDDKDVQDGYKLADAQSSTSTTAVNGENLARRSNGMFGLGHFLSTLRNSSSDHDVADQVPTTSASPPTMNLLSNASKTSKIDSKPVSATLQSSMTASNLGSSSNLTSRTFIDTLMPDLKPNPKLEERLKHVSGLDGLSSIEKWMKIGALTDEHMEELDTPGTSLCQAEEATVKKSTVDEPMEASEVENFTTRPSEVVNKENLVHVIQESAGSRSSAKVQKPNWIDKKKKLGRIQTKSPPNAAPMIRRRAVRAGMPITQFRPWTRQNKTIPTQGPQSHQNSSTTSNQDVERRLKSYIDQHGVVVIDDESPEKLPVHMIPAKPARVYVNGVYKERSKIMQDDASSGRTTTEIKMDENDQLIKTLMEWSPSRYNDPSSEIRMRPDILLTEFVEKKSWKPPTFSCVYKESRGYVWRAELQNVIYELVLSDDERNSGEQWLCRAIMLNLLGTKTPELIIRQ